MIDQMKEILENGCREMGLELSERQAGQFLKYFELLTERNKVMNLTAITEPEEVARKHFLDSLLLFQAIPGVLEGEKSCIDVGTGAGFPGIPLKIMFPKLNMTLLDSLNKRVKFLEEVSSELGLTGIMAVHGRAEDFGHDSAYREQFDFCVSRAVANFATLSEYCIPFVKVGGVFVSYKSGTIEEELKQGRNAVKRLGGELEPVIFCTIPGTDVERAFVPVKKISGTGKKYPRKAGMPGKEPLK